MSTIETSVFKNGNSQAITIQNKVMKELNLKIGDRVTIDLVDNKLIIKKKNEDFKSKWEKFFDQGGTYEDYTEENFGEPIGREEW